MSPYDEFNHRVGDVTALRYCKFHPEFYEELNRLNEMKNIGYLSSFGVKLYDIMMNFHASMIE